MSPVIYVLKCPRSLTVRYVGFTSQGIEKRLIQHVKDARRGQIPCRRWIRKLLSAGTLPIIEVIEYVTGTDWQDRERYWINEFGGMRSLLNCTTGGDGGRQFSKATKAKMARAQLGKRRGPHSAEHRAKIAKSVAGHNRKHSEESKRKIAAGIKGRVRSHQHCVNISRSWTPERRAKMSAANNCRWAKQKCH